MISPKWSRCFHQKKHKSYLLSALTFVNRIRWTARRIIPLQLYRQIIERACLVVGRRARTKHYQKQGPNASYVTERNETTRLACVSWAMRDERCNESLKRLVNYLSVSSTSKKPIESRSCVGRAFHVPRFVRIYRTRVNVEFFLDFLLERNQVGVRFLLRWK